MVPPFLRGNMSVLEEFKTILRKADFMGLIKIGAPLDEYDSEALHLSLELKGSESLLQIQQKVWDEFYHAFCTGTQGVSDIPFKMSKDEAIRTIGSIDRFRHVSIQLKEVLDNGKNCCRDNS
jgi:hypothetical protein